MNTNQTNKPFPPFSLQHSPNVPELLQQLNCSLALSTYQAGKLVLISAKDHNNLVQLPRTFEKPMGIAEDPEKDKLAIACKDEVIVFANSAQLAKFYPKSPNKYDALYVPRSTYYTGTLDIHDLNFGNEGGLFAVNTLFSSIININSDYNFTPYWTPQFIDELVSEDRCHLNGMAMQNGLPKYVTAFNQGNTSQSWRENITETGVVIDVETNEVIADKLAMPHSPRIYNGGLFVLLSASGELIRIDLKTKSIEVIKKMNGFVRGLSFYNDYVFIGLSKLRENSSTFGKLNFAQHAKEAGITILHLPTKAVVGEIKYLSSVEEIYDVHILKDKKRPNILNTLTPDHKGALMIPSSTFWAKK